MTVREIINSLEEEKRQLKKENQNLKEENQKLYAEIDFLRNELSKKEVIEEPVVEEVKPDGAFLDPVVEEVPEKPKRSRKKKVEPVEESDNAEGLDI